MTTAVSRGINWLLRLDYPSDTSELGLNRHYGKTVDALEMIDALEVLRTMFNETSTVVGPMYRGEKEFDFIHDLKQAVEGYFFVGEDQKDGALRKRKYRSIVALLLNPLIDEFQNVSHQDALMAYNDVINDAISEIVDNDHDSSPDDAFVVQHLIAKEVARRQRVQATVDGIMRLRRRKRQRKKK